MSWLGSLYETYQNMSRSGLYKDLLPIAHTTQICHIEITLNERSEIVDATVIDKENAETLIPCTEESAGRTGTHPKNHPLMDKLQYIAGDYTKFGGEKGELFHEEYMRDLKDWCNSQYLHPKVKIIYDYLKKGTVIADLVSFRVLHCDANGKLYKKYPDKNNVPAIFRVVQGSQSDAFVRFKVIGVDDKAEIWEDESLQQSYINYYLSKFSNKKLCYVTGEIKSCSSNHPNKIRNTGDKAKLISSNDTSGFTFRGRFNEADEAASVSYEVSQGAHNALKWLIKNQGTNFGGRVFVAWNPKGYQIPNLMEDSYDLFFNYDKPQAYTAQEFAQELGHALAGYKANLDYHDKIIIMGFDAATVGRLAITFYREILANELIDNLKYWHSACAWKHRYKFSKDKSPVEFYGAPSPKDIALAAFGIERTNYLEMDDKLLKNVVERLLPCIIDRAPLPYDIVINTYRNVCHPQNYKNPGSWQKVLSICCSLLKKYYFEKSNGKEEWTVEINEKEESLAYLCGRMLAVADALEKRTYTSEERNSRTTCAMRFFTKFAEHPCQTWEIVTKMLAPYIAKLGVHAYHYQKMLAEISVKINPEEFKAAKNLDGRMALGFYAQQNFIYSKKDNETNVNDENKSF
mgnify:CR=1 FL=1